MNQQEFDAQIIKSSFLKQIIAELKKEQEILQTACEQAIAMIATAAARQLNADVVAQNLERMEAIFAHQVPNEARTKMIRLAISLVRDSGTPAGQSH